MGPNQKDMELRALSRLVKRQRAEIKELKGLKEMNRRLNISRGQMRNRIGMFERRFTDLVRQKDLQLGNRQIDLHNDHMRGIANGLLLAVSTMKDTDLEYIEPPKKKRNKQ